MKNRNNPNIPGARMNRDRGTPANIRADQHQADEQIRVGHLWSNSAPAGHVPTADGSGGVSWQPNAAAGVFAYTPSPDYSLYGPYNVAPAAGIADAIQIGRLSVVGADRSIGIGLQATTGASAIDSISIGNDTTANSPDSVVIGSSARDAGGSDNAIAIGSVAYVGGNADFSIAIGHDSYAYTNKIYQTAIGANTYCAGAYSLAIGPFADVQSDDGVAIGSGVTIAPGANAAVALGVSATVLGGASNSIALGNSANILTGAYGAIAVGHGAQVYGYFSVATGYYARAGQFGIAIGSSADAGVAGQYSNIAIGKGSDASGGNQRIAIGENTNVGADYAVAIGNSQTNTVANSVQFGTNAGSFLRFDDFTPAAGAVTAAHYFIVEFNAGRYKIPLEAIP